VFAVTGLDDRVERLGVAPHGFHDRDGSEVALVVAFHGVGTEQRCQRHDLGARGLAVRSGSTWSDICIGRSSLLGEAGSCGSRAE
jgi:hypothetical protein